MVGAPVAGVREDHAWTVDSSAYPVAASASSTSSNVVSSNVWHSLTTLNLGIGKWRNIVKSAQNQHKISTKSRKGFHACSRENRASGDTCRRSGPCQAGKGGKPSQKGTHTRAYRTVRRSPCSQTQSSRRTWRGAAWGSVGGRGWAWGSAIVADEPRFPPEGDLYWELHRAYIDLARRKITRYVIVFWLQVKVTKKPKKSGVKYLTETKPCVATQRGTPYDNLGMEGACVRASKG